VFLCRCDATAMMLSRATSVGGSQTVHCSVPILSPPRSMKSPRSIKVAYPRSLPRKKDEMIYILDRSAVQDCFADVMAFLLHQAW
jgi:hypothetical protein